MKHLSIDIETYSSVDIKTGGLYKYVQSPDFEILLLAYSVDGSDVEILDLKQGEQLSTLLINSLMDSNVIKHAYNAPFEWFCLSKYLRVQFPWEWLKQWQCTMLHGLYCGYAAGLGPTGKALGLSEDKKKLSIGKTLIKTFCTPCKPTRSNGNKTRVLPHNEPEKWELFKKYCIQDVVTEMEIERKLSNFPVPSSIQSQWVTDQIINSRGVQIDLRLLDGALWCNEKETDLLTQEAKEITSLENPNSTEQLKGWLRKQTPIEIDNLQKDTVKELIGQDIGKDALRALEIRQELSKTSNKKYTAMQNALCDDGRIRGLLQFYGANRTGRWAGRLVQVQNLPRTYLTDLLPLAREFVKNRKLKNIGLVFGSVQDTLSQLIRTAFVSREGYLFVDADFSAIEARVIAWLAGEQWRLDVFNTHGKIYEASASQMFGVPIEKISKGNPEYALRQKGKVAELALGYQGASGALVQMGALNMGLCEKELPDIVQKWRGSNKRIVDLWYKVENAALQAIKTGRAVAVNGLVLAREADMQNNLDFITVTLPSGRKLFYVHPHLGVNQWGNESLHYYGMDQTTKKWQTVDTYGGKLVENIVQAIARDCLAVNIERLESIGFRVVFHVHDEVVIEVSKEMANLDKVCEIMSEPIMWAPGLPLNADGYISEFFKKE